MIRCWGANTSGELGDGTQAMAIVPSTVQGLAATAVAAGDQTCAIAMDATVWCWGDDARGQLGLGISPFAPAPVAVLLPPAIAPAVQLDIPPTSGSVFVPASLAEAPGAEPAVGYLLTESAVTPTAGAAWSPELPTGYTFTHGDGSRTLHGWIRGPDGSISGASASTVIDTTRPTVSITAPAMTRVRQIAIRLSGSDAASGIGAWLVSETPSQPLPTDPRWLSSMPTSFELSDADGAKTVYAWTRDQAGNVSNVGAASMLLDRSGPVGLIAPRPVQLASGALTSKVPLSVSWPAATDEVSGVASYELAVSGNSGVTWSSLSLASRAALAATISLVPGAYRLRVRAIDGVGNASAWIVGGPFSFELRQQTNSLVRFTGWFASAALSSASGGSVKWSSTAGRAATISRSARGFAWVSTLGPNRGLAAVYLDGRRVATIDLYSRTYSAGRVVWRVTFASGGTHTVKVVVLGQKRAASTGRRVDIDAFAVLR